MRVVAGAAVGLVVWMEGGEEMGGEGGVGGGVDGRAGGGSVISGSESTSGMAVVPYKER